MGLDKGKRRERNPAASFGLRVVDSNEMGVDRLRGVTLDYVKGFGDGER